MSAKEDEVTVRSRWSRIDQVGLEALLYAVAGLAALSAVLRLVEAVRGDPIELTATLPDRVVPQVDGFGGPLTGTVAIEDPTVGQQTLALLPPFVAFVLVGVGVALLLGVARSVRAGDPFTPANGRRLLRLALVVMAGGVGVQLLEDVTRNQLLSQVAVVAPDLGSEFTLPLWPLAAGLLVAFVGEVFARGSALRAEVEGLV